MGWYIGNQQVGLVNVSLAGGNITSNEAYIGLTDEYSQIKKGEVYKCRAGIEVFQNKAAKVAGKSAMSCDDLSGIKVIDFDVTEADFLTKTAAQIVMENLPTAIGSLKPTWVGKLVEDF